MSSPDRDRALDRLLEEADAVAARLADELDLDDGLEVFYDRTPLLEAPAEET